jgi:L-fucose isomerase-like protein
MVSMNVILSATGNAWGYLFKEEEREKEIQRFEKKLNGIKGELPEDLDMEIHSFTDASEETNFVDSLSDEDLVVYCALSFRTPGLNILLGKNIPMIFYQQMYAGHTWNAKEVRKDNVILFMGSEIKDLTKKIRVLYAYKKFAQSKYLFVTTENRNDILERKGILEKMFNFKGEMVKPEELMKYYENSSIGKAEKGAKTFIENSIGVIEPTEEEIVSAYRMYLGMENMIKDKDADGITIDCLSLFHIMKAYPCIGFTFLNDRGIPAACEGDVFSLFTMYMFNYLTGLPSYISDPVIDISKNTVIHAHCVAPTKIDGENTSPYIIRSHAEDNKSVSLQVRFERMGEKMTVANLLKDADGGIKVLVSTGRLLGNPETNRGCRTKFELKVEDAQRMLTNWPNGKVSCFGLHRVLVYKDWMDEVKDLAKLLNLEVIEE